MVFTGGVSTTKGRSVLILNAALLSARRAPHARCHVLVPSSVSMAPALCHHLPDYTPSCLNTAPHFSLISFANSEGSAS